MATRDGFLDTDLAYRWQLERFAVEVKPLRPLDISIKQIWFRALRNDALAFGKDSYKDYRILNGFVYTRATPSPLPPTARAEKRQAFREDCERFLRHGSSYWHEVSLPEIEANLDRLRRFPHEKAPQTELAGHLREAVAVYERHWEIHWHLGNEFAIERFLNTYEQLLHGGADEAGELLRGVPTMSTRLVDGLRGLAAIAARSSDVATGVRKGRVPDSPEFRDALRGFLDVFGLRTGAGYGSAATLHEPTWLEHPQPVLRLVASYLDAGDRVGAITEPQLPARKSIAGRAQAARFRSELAAARAASGLLEDHNYYIEQLTGGALRLAVMRLADSLVASGHLEASEDVFFLYLNELINAPLVPPELTRDRLVEHRLQYDIWSQAEPPDELGGLEPSQLVMAPPTQVREEGPVLHGIAASRGSVEGTAYVALDQESIPDVNPGEILVARNAGPLWSPLLPLLGGLVLDEGAILQHAALLAREYSVPAVFMTRRATAAIATGTQVRVDGDAGTVTLL